jgi:hypothetical protein
MRVRVATSGVAVRTDCDIAASSSSRSAQHPLGGMRRRGTWMAPVFKLLLATFCCVSIGDCRQWSVEELRTLKFPYSHGVDLGMAVCKAGRFLLFALYSAYIVRVRNLLAFFHCRIRPLFCALRDASGLCAAIVQLCVRMVGPGTRLYVWLCGAITTSREQ